jgi:hypothetical protein
VAAVISIVETCRRLQIPVREYLSAVLMGWLASAHVQVTKGIVLISSLLIVQNILGIIACFVIRSHFASANRSILAYQARLVEAEIISQNTATLSLETCMPLRFYSSCLILMVTTLTTILIAWCILPFQFA